MDVTPEKGAKLRVLRWKRFVQGDEDQYMAEHRRSSREKTGIEVRVDNEGWEDVRPKAAVAANVGSGSRHHPVARYDDAQPVSGQAGRRDRRLQLSRRQVRRLVSDVCKQYLQPDGKSWIGVPLGCAGNAIVYRESQMKEAGFDAFPKDTAGFLKLCKALKAKGTPGGFALGNATGDGNAWATGSSGRTAASWSTRSNKVVIDSPETLKALEYAKELYATFIPGTLSWLDPNNNKAFLDGQIALTANGISIYYAAKNVDRTRR